MRVEGQGEQVEDGKRNLKLARAHQVRVGLYVLSSLALRFQLREVYLAGEMGGRPQED